MSESKQATMVAKFRYEAAELIDQNMEEILSRWEVIVRRDIPAARHQEKLLLRNHLIPYLVTLVQMLREGSVKSARSRTTGRPDFDTSANETHGRLRATLPGYSVEQVIDEYIAFRQTITDFIESHGFLNAQVLEVICAVNEKAVLHAATQFTASLQILRQHAVSMLMHDIRNPLNVISTTAELIKAKSGKHSDHMESIMANTGKIDSMVSELLDAVRLEAGQGLELKFTRRDLREAIQISVEGACLAYPKRIRLKLPDQPAMGMIDPSAFARAVENLISNAVKYGDSHKEVLVELETTANAFIISVHNWGKPIDDKDQATVFVTFARSQDPEKNHHERGWGLGLAFVKAVAEGHGGEVRLESSEHRGTTFSILLPRRGENREVSEL